MNIEDFNYEEEQVSFLSYLDKNKNYSSKTRESYGTDIQLFLKFLKQDNIPLNQVERGDVRRYLFTLNQQKYKPSSIRRKISSLRHFYQFLVLYKGYKKNPFTQISSPRKNKKLPEFFSHEEITTLLDNNKKRTDFLASRDQALMELLFSSGLRASEIIHLTFSQIDFENNTIHIIGKGRKERLTHFNNVTKNAILSYKDKERIILLGKQEDLGYIFLNKKGEKLTERGLEYIVEQASKKANFPLHVYPHMFRHSFATELMNNGADLRVIQELLGHSSVSTTAIYTDVSFQDLKKTYDQCFPKLMGEDKEK